MNDDNERIHAFLDGELDSASGFSSDEKHHLLKYKNVLNELESAHVHPPEGFAEQIVAALPNKIRQTIGERIRSLWPSGRTWITPVLAGATAAAILILLIPGLIADNRDLAVLFEVHAPDANRVELIGSFNNWKRGEILLEGPDASGHWSVSVPLQHGRHEYLFVIDGKEFQADPSAPFQRPDGFGRINSLMDI